MKIKKIKKVKPRIVYALKTSSHTFIADNLAHHNCYACNVGRGGEQYIFGKNLEKEIGEEGVERLRQKRYQAKKITPKEWEKLANHYRAEAMKIAAKKNLEI